MLLPSTPAGTSDTGCFAPVSHSRRHDETSTSSTASVDEKRALDSLTTARRPAAWCSSAYICEFTSAWAAL